MGIHSQEQVSILRCDHFASNVGNIFRSCGEIELMVECYKTLLVNYKFVECILTNKEVYSHSKDSERECDCVLTNCIQIIHLLPFLNLCNDHRFGDSIDHGLQIHTQDIKRSDWRLILTKLFTDPRMYDNCNAVSIHSTNY